MDIFGRWVPPLAAVLGAEAALLGAFGANWFGMQDMLCARSETISDRCGSLGLGDRPTEVERLAFALLPPHDCAALRDFLGQFPESVLAPRVQAALGARTLEKSRTEWDLLNTEVMGHVGPGEPSVDLNWAMADALRRSEVHAAQVTCASLPLGQGVRRHRTGLHFTHHSHHEVEPRAGQTRAFVAGDGTRFDCNPHPAGGFSCEFTYRATCQFQAPSDVEVCGAP